MKEHQEQSVLNWSMEIGLLNNTTAIKQAIKLAEEWGETGRALLHSDTPKIIDGIGDAQVVLVQIANKIGYTIPACMTHAVDVFGYSDPDKIYLAIGSRIGDLSSILITSALSAHHLARDIIGDIITGIERFAHALGLDYEHCLDVALDEISRKERIAGGEVINGNFVRRQS